MMDSTLLRVLWDLWDEVSYSSLEFTSITKLYCDLAVADLELSTRIMIEASVKLSRTLPLFALPYREVVLPKKLKFGYYFTGQLNFPFTRIFDSSHLRDLD